jgi:hypothetical protein
MAVFGYHPGLLKALLINDLVEDPVLRLQASPERVKQGLTLNTK